MVKKTNKTPSKSTKSLAAKGEAALDETRQEVLDQGYKHVKPQTLARHRVVKLTAGILISILGIFICVITLLVYLRHEDNSLVYGVSKIIPYPMAKVNGDFVQYSDYLFEVRYRKNIYEHPTGPAASSQEPIDFSSPANRNLLLEIQQSSLRRAKMKVLMRQLADKYDIAVSRNDLDQAMDEIIKKQGGEDKFMTAIEQFYGWDMEDFRREYRLQLLTQKLEQKLLPDISSEQKQLTESLLSRARAGEDFASLAKETSQDTGSKDNGGDLGFVSAETQFVQEFKDAALKLELGQVSEIVTTSFGYHIIKATEKKDNEIKVSHILIKYAKDMNSFLEEQLDQSKSSDYIKLPQPENQEETPPQES